MSTIPPGRRSHRKSRHRVLAMQEAKGQGKKSINAFVRWKLILLCQCDETQPHCRNCNRHGVVCSFARPLTVASTSQVDLAESPRSISGPESAESGVASNTAQNPPSLPSLPSRPMVTPFPSTLAVFDLELLHHYTTSTCYTLSRSPAVQAIWRDEAPRIGFEMPPVLHTILALSALHLGKSDESRRERCLAHAQCTTTSP